PLSEEVTPNYYRSIVQTPYKEERSDILPQTFFMQEENKLKTFSSDDIPLKQKENELTDEYSTLIAGAEIHIKGQT
ncbi:M3 family oligoendopeptidase, partial [Streptococcus suis]